MNQMIMPVLLWAVGGAVTWLAGRYHLNTDQQQQLTVDILGGVTYAGSAAWALALHWKHMWAPPPNSGASNAQNLGPPVPPGFSNPNTRG
jgi:hypothetical protein